MTKHRIQYTVQTVPSWIRQGFYELVCNIEYEYAASASPFVTITSIEVDHIVPSWTNYVYAYGWLKDRGWLPMVDAIAKRILDVDPVFYQTCLLRALK